MIGLDSPWGRIQDRYSYAPGITVVDTARHGGVYLSPERNAKVPGFIKASTWNKQGYRGWYEEDCDVAWIPLCFPGAYAPDKVDHARRFVRSWKPDLLARLERHQERERQREWRYMERSAASAGTTGDNL